MRGAIWGWCAALALATIVPVAAQTASQVTPPSFRPVRPQAGSSVVFSGQPGLGTPAGAERLSVRLSAVAIENGFAELAEAGQALIARLSGRRVPAADIFAAARELEAAYSRAGFVLARVLLPAQTLKDGGRLRLVVIDGFIERIDYRDAPASAQARIGALLEPLIGQRGLRLDAIERQLLLAGDTPGVGLRSTLSPGAQNGGTVLIVEATYRPVSGFVGEDNTLARSLGRWTAGLGLDVNTALGFGETFYVRAFGHPTAGGSTSVGSLFGENPRVRTLSGGFILPIGIDGLTFNVEGTESRATPLARNGVQTGSVYDRLSFRLRYPVLRTREANLNTELAFDASSEQLRLFVPGARLPLALDRLRVLRLGADGDYRVEGGGLLAGRGGVSFGLDALGARSAADATPLLPLTRVGADAEFQKFEAALSFSQPIAEGFAAGFYARGQSSFGQVLPRSEQIGIASFQELSTFDAGTLGGDSGWIVRGELSSPQAFPVGGYPVQVTPYVFAATGALYLEQPTILEQATTRVSSLGFGVRLAAALDGEATQATLTLEYGRRFRDDAFPDANKFTLVGSIRF